MKKKHRFFTMIVCLAASAAFIGAAAAIFKELFEKKYFSVND